MDLRARPADVADLPALLALQQRFDTHWFGAAEHDEAEVRESFDRVDPLEQHSLVLHDDDRLLAAGWWWKHDDTTLLVDPEVTGDEVPDRLVAWLADSGCAHAEVLAPDRLLRAALERQGWTHWLSQFELLRDPDLAGPLPEPHWPDGVTPSSLRGDVAVVHRLVYEGARW